MGIFKLGRDRDSNRLNNREKFDFAKRLSELEAPLFLQLFANCGLRKVGTWLHMDALTSCPWELTELSLSRIYLDSRPSTVGGGQNLTSDLEPLPYQNNSMSGVLCVHALEYQKHPWVVLEELNRVLEPGGSMVIFSFNPYSLWGLRKCLSTQKQAPWDGYFHSPFRLQRFYLSHGYELVAQQTFMFNLPFNKSLAKPQSRGIEWLGRYCWPSFGGCNVLVAKKQTIPMTPVKSLNRWLHRTPLKGAVEPT